MQQDQGANEMANEDGQKYSIIIEYDDFLTRFDLDEILSSIDRIIENELLSMFDPAFRFWPNYPYSYRETPELSYVGITAADRGSITLTVLASGAVATYVARRFKKGVDKSLLAEQLERSGLLAGNVLGSVLELINDWAEKYVPKQRELGGKIKSVRVRAVTRGMTTALTYALLAQQAYLRPPMIGNIDGAGRAIVSTTDDGCAVTFRGSDNLESWLRDLEIDTVAVNGLGNVHSGFFAAWDTIAASVLSLQPEPEVLAGHSLGAAIALIAAANLCLIRKPPKAVYAFEPPRVSTDYIIHKLLIDNGVKLFLTRNGRDVVTQVPMAIPGWPWNEIPLIRIGDQDELFDNINDHNIQPVIKSVRVYITGPSGSEAAISDIYPHLNFLIDAAPGAPSENGI